MPLPGISLVGFMDQQAAMGYLQISCVPADPDPAILTAEWQTATGKLGPAIANAGYPAISTIPATHNQHVQQLQTNLAGLFQTGWSVCLVEIDPLLAYQVHIVQGHSVNHCAGL